MRHRVLYVSSKENTKKVAEAISSGAKITSDPVEKHTAITDVGILFLGSGIRFGKISSQLRNVASALDPKEVKLVVAFSTSKKADDTVLKELKSILEPKGIKVHNEGFFCKGSFLFFNGGRPNAKDLKDAQDFGAKIISTVRVK